MQQGSAFPRIYGRISKPIPDWLGRQEVEAILDPDLPIVDAHFHYFIRPVFNYLPDDFDRDLSTGHRIDTTIFVECHTGYRTEGPEALRPVGETEYVAAIVASNRQSSIPRAHLPSGMVGFADLMLGASVETVLTAHLEAGGALFKGIRYTTSRDPAPIFPVYSESKPGVMQDEQWRDGLRATARMGLSYDALLFHHQLMELVDVADAIPELQIVVNHCGGVLGFGPYAGRHDEILAEWRLSIAELAKRPNVSMKLGGMLLKLATYDYLNAPEPPTSLQLAEMFKPYVHTAIELFGPDRCMFESNYPVDKIVTGYATLWNAFKRLTADASPSEKTALFNGTARRIYRL